MDFLNYLTAITLLLFMVLATYDGAYLHLFKFRLYAQTNSKIEHITHTLRAIFFPLIIWALFLNNGNALLFYLGLVLAFTDFIVLALDAFYEKDSRAFMGGLPQKEYIMHLFSNAFHYGLVILAMVLQLTLSNNTIRFNAINYEGFSGTFLLFIAKNALPGATLLALLHVLLCLPKPAKFIDRYRLKISCC